MGVELLSDRFSDQIAGVFVYCVGSDCGFGAASVTREDSARLAVCRWRYRRNPRRASPIACVRFPIRGTGASASGRAVTKGGFKNSKC